ncbi:MAG: acyl-CoA dehydrogenase family protein [Nitrospinota bacterium]
MEFELSETHRMLRTMVRELAESRIAPRAAEVDEREEYPEDIFALLREAHLLGIFLPEGVGGGGLGFLGGCVAIEEIARVCSNSALLIVLTMLASRPIALGGSAELKGRHLPALARGEVRGAFALTEPHAGSDAANIRTRAAREGDGWVLNGQKCFCTGPPYADFVLTAAKTDPGAGTRGISFFLVPLDAPGFRIGRQERKMGMRGVPSVELFYEGCRVPAESVVGELNRGFHLAMRGFNQVRPAVGARGVGLAQGCLDYALRYAREREAFGGAIANLQAIQFMLADMALGTEAARLLVYRAAAGVDEGLIGREHAHLSSMAKCFAADNAMRVAVDAIQVLGGAGYMKDHPLERFMRDAKQLQIVEGTNQIQRLVIARNLLGL